MSIELCRRRHNSMNQIHLSDPRHPYDPTCHAEAPRGLLNKQREAFPPLKTEAQRPQQTTNNEELIYDSWGTTKGTEGIFKGDFQGTVSTSLQAPFCDCLVMRWHSQRVDSRK